MQEPVDLVAVGRMAEHRQAEVVAFGDEDDRRLLSSSNRAAVGVAAALVAARDDDPVAAVFLDDRLGAAQAHARRGRWFHAETNDRHGSSLQRGGLERARRPACRSAPA